MEDDKRVNYKLDAINKLYIPIDIEIKMMFNQLFNFKNNIMKYLKI